MGGIRRGRLAAAERPAGDSAVDPAAESRTHGPDDPPHHCEEVAREICLRLLTARARTRAELSRALSDRGVSREVADVVLDRLAEVGLVDDAAYANSWVERRHAGRGLARRALADELRRKGVDRETTESAVGQLDADLERQAAASLVRRRAGALRTLPVKVRERRLVGMLSRRGYSPSLAVEVVREVLEADDQTTTGP